MAFLTTFNPSFELPCPASHFLCHTGVWWNKWKRAFAQPLMLSVEWCYKYEKPHQTVVNIVTDVTSAGAKAVALSHTGNESWQELSGHRAVQCVWLMSLDLPWFLLIYIHTSYIPWSEAEHLAPHIANPHKQFGLQWSFLRLGNIPIVKVFNYFQEWY